jgi:NADPH2 dehydrogenase
MAKLFIEGKLKDLTLKNRIVMAPMCMYSSDDDGFVKDFHSVHYGARALGGTGLVILEATAVEKRGRISGEDLGIWSDAHIEPLADLVDLIHQSGAKAGIQLGHAGRKCAVTSETIISSSNEAFSEDYQKPEKMNQETIQQVIKAFGEGARRSEEAGFDTIEIHGAHGYLINQFLSPLSNLREDEYGGSLENRARFLKEVMEEIHRHWPSNKPVILRVSAEDYKEEGNHPEDLAKMINQVKDLGLDLINVSSGGAVPAKITPYPGYQLQFAEKIKEITKLPVMAGGLITRGEMAEEALQNHRADYIFLGRELLRNPHWPHEAAKVLGVDIEAAKQYDRAYR